MRRPPNLVVRCTRLWEETVLPKRHCSQQLQRGPSKGHRNYSNYPIQKIRYPACGLVSPSLRLGAEFPHRACGQLGELSAEQGNLLGALASTHLGLTQGRASYLADQPTHPPGCLSDRVKFHGFPGASC